MSWPMMVGIWILCVSATGFACAVRELPAWYQAVAAAMPLTALVMLWLTHVTDPGILPTSASKDPIIEILERDGPSAVATDTVKYLRDQRTQAWMRRTTQPLPRASHSNTGGADAWRGRYSAAASNAEQQGLATDSFESRGSSGVEEGMEEVYEKYCATCNIWRPPRSHHCSTCGYCMARFDHHCGVIDNCVALHNHRWFAGFLVASQAGCCLFLAGTIWRLRRMDFPNDGSTQNAESYILLVLAVVYGYHAVMLLFGTAHCLAVVCDITTKDCVSNGSNPSQLWWYNAPCMPGGSRTPMHLVRAWRAVCCGPIRIRPQQEASGPPAATQRPGAFVAQSPLRHGPAGAVGVLGGVQVVFGASQWAGGMSSGGSRAEALPVVEGDPCQARGVQLRPAAGSAQP